MKNISLLFGILLLHGCSLLSGNNIAPGYIEAYKSIKNIVLGYEDDSLTQELVDNIPYASSVLKIGKGPSGLIILETINKNVLTWVSADDVYLIIKDGRIIRTEGLTNNLTNYILPFRSNFLEYKDGETFTYYVSYDFPSLTDLKLEANLKFKGKENVKVFKKEMELSLVEEVIENKFIGWKVKNRYWVDKDNFVWKSEQYISPKLPKFVIEVTKKPS